MVIPEKAIKQFRLKIELKKFMMWEENICLEQAFEVFTLFKTIVLVENLYTTKCI